MDKSKPLLILNVLMNDGDWLTTNQIRKKVCCDRKTVYRAIDILEICGFGIDVRAEYIRGKKNNLYKYRGLYGI